MYAGSAESSWTVVSKCALSAIVLALLGLPAPAVLAAEGRHAAGSTSGKRGTQEIDAASRHFTEAIEFFRLGKWDAARVEFEAAYALSKAPDLLHNLSMVAEKQSQWGDALSLEQRFVSARWKELSSAERVETETRLAMLRKRAGNEGRLSSTVGEGSEARDAATSRRPPAGSLALIGGGAGLLLVGIGCGAGALVTNNAIEAGGSYFPREYQALYDRGQALDRAGIALDVIGGVALTAGVVWAIVDRVRPRPRELSARRRMFGSEPLRPSLSWTFE